MFRKYATASTDCYVSLLARLSDRGRAGVRFAALIILLAIASATVFATPQQGKRVRKHKAKEPSTRAQAEEATPDAKVPVRLTRFDTPDGPCIIARIGEFPFNLNEVGQIFLERKFFVRFASGALGLDHSPDSEAHTTLEVAMLPQEKKNQREGDFIFGKVKGHIIAVVEKRHVLVACMFKQAQNQSLQMAAVKALVESLTAG